MATALAQRFQEALPYHGGSFQKIGSEESHTVESYERKIHGTPNSEPQRQFSTNQYTERRTYGRDENGDVVVMIEKDPKEPVRPATPVRPLEPLGRDSPRDMHLLRPAKPLETLPLTTIPRIETHHSSHHGYPQQQQALPYYRRSSAAASPRSVHIEHDHSPRSVASAPLSPRSTTSSGVSSLNSVPPLKKVTRKSRLVSIYDGTPLTPFTEKVTYEPKYPEPAAAAEYFGSTGSIYAADERPINYDSYREGYSGGGYRSQHGDGFDSYRSRNLDSYGSRNHQHGYWPHIDYNKRPSSARSRSMSRLSFSPSPRRHRSSSGRHVSMADECAYIVENPLFRDF